MIYFFINHFESFLGSDLTLNLKISGLAKHFMITVYDNWELHVIIILEAMMAAINFLQNY